MTSEPRQFLEILSSDEIDELLEPENLHKARAVIQSDDMQTQMAIVNETFPRIAKTLAAHWDSQEFYPYMNSLLFSDRADRLGFPPQIVAALTNLQRIHSRTCPRNGSASGVQAPAAAP
jgi:hypothetical protein